jgi:hypothetical protein
MLGTTALLLALLAAVQLAQARAKEFLLLSLALEVRFPNRAELLCVFPLEPLPLENIL